jgi:hypothetical protein
MAGHVQQCIAKGTEEMTLEVRRIVTTNTKEGKAMVASDERLTAVSRGLGHGIDGCEIWSTDAMPVDNSARDEHRQRAGVVRTNNYVGSGSGSAFRITQFAPGHALFPHRTQTIDYAILLTGQLDLELDDEATVRLMPGDVVVQRGTIHCWINRGGVPAAIAFILLDAKPCESDKGPLPTYFPSPNADTR